MKTNRVVWFLALIAALWLAPKLWSQAGHAGSSAMIHLTGTAGRSSYHIHGSDTTRTANIWELATRVAFTQLARSDTLRVISSSTADSTYITVYGILAADSSLQKIVFRVSGTDSVFGPPTGYGNAKRFKYVSYAVADTESAGTISIVGKTSGLVTTIRPGFLETEVAHHYTGRRGAVIVGWSAEADTTNATNVELRYYPDFADSRETPETGKRVLDGPILLRPADGRRYRNYPLPDARWEIGPAGYLAIFSNNGTTTARLENAIIDVYEK